MANRPRPPNGGRPADACVDQAAEGIDVRRGVRLVTAQELRRQVVLALGLAGVEQADEVAVLDRARLAQQAPDEPLVARELGPEQLERDQRRRSARARRGRPGPCRPRPGEPRCGTARRRRPPRPPVEDNPAGLDRRSGTLDSRVVRRSRKPWIGLLVAACTVAAIPSAGAVTDQGPAPLPPPVAGKTVNAKVKAGKVRFRLPGQTAFVELTAPQQLPIGTTFDTTAGRVTLTSAADSKGATQHAWFYEGTFTIGQTTGLAADHDARARRRAAQLPEGRAGGRRRDQAQGAPPVGRRQGPLPHRRALQLGDGARHALGGHRPLRRDAHARRARHGHGARPTCATRP